MPKRCARRAAVSIRASPTLSGEVEKPHSASKRLFRKAAGGENDSDQDFGSRPTFAAQLVNRPGLHSATDRWAVGMWSALVV